MFRTMRRKKQLLSPEDAASILARGTSGVLALSGDDGYPYAVPLSYAYANGKIYFHGAPEGHRVDAVRHSGKASFCVIDRDEPVAERITTYYRSAIAFGKIRILTEESERLTAARLICDKYFPDCSELREAEIEKDGERMCVMEFVIEHLTGKEAIELVNQR